MTEEAQLQDTRAGLEPAGDGWFVVNVRDTAWMTHDMFGSGCVFENRQNLQFPELGINIGVLQPGQPACLYHEEGAQEDFLVLAGAMPNDFELHLCVPRVKLRFRHHPCDFYADILIGPLPSNLRGSAFL